ncbi:trehalase-like domain-containing protein [Pseudarthrobacter sp. NIBRBAC000502772]|uniref:trehalase-like domain-containing protein n=1 Tax=Pseudarthrobacter sp. NIBRBAC000502772 TaxID=2590775 RepID=UPI00352D50B6
MAVPIEDYAFLSDLSTGALISRQGGVDWLCLPRFDSASIFGALLGSEEHGRWLLTPNDPDAHVVERLYVDSTFVLETTWKTSRGKVRITDFMPVGEGRSSLMRRVTGVSGAVTLRQELRIRPRYGAVLPWMSRRRVNATPEGSEVLFAMAGPDAWGVEGAPSTPRP